MGGDFDNRQLDELAHPTRTYRDILALIPGNAPRSAGSGGTNVRVDGVTDTNLWGQDWPAYVPCNDGIQSTRWTGINRTRFSNTIRTFDGNSDNGVYYE
jgi:hypothetical protein